MAVGHTISVASYAAALVRHRFSTDDTSFTLAVRFADAHTPEQILARFREGTSGRPRGAARFVPTRELFTDHLVHHQDIRRPLGAPRVIPADRAVAALDSAPAAELSGRQPRPDGRSADRGNRRRRRARRAATSRSGGRRRPCCMALTGRPEAVADLTGTGVPLLTSRLTPAITTRKAVR